MYRGALKYLLGLTPFEPKIYFDLGTAYHEFMEGKPESSISMRFGHVVDDAKTYFERRKAGPPLPDAVEVERTRIIFDGLMTSKPDRVERIDGKLIPRDFKTAAKFSDSDKDFWNVDLGIIGEAIAVGAPFANVDIVRKYGDKPPHVKLVKVTLTDMKFSWATHKVTAAWGRWAEALKAIGAKKAPADVHEHFPRDFSQCFGKYGACEFYTHCWGKLPESAMYKVRGPSRRWLEGDDSTGKLRPPNGLTKSIVELAAKRAAVLLKAEVTGK